MAKLSVVISAYNEEKMLPDCLKSVKWADEIIVVDNNSTDKTAQIAKKYTKKVFHRPNNPMLNVNKNFGFTKATGDWILSLDADERVTDELHKELLDLNRLKADVNGFCMPRKNMIFGKWIKYTGWYPDHQMRLFRKGKGKFPEKHVHEMIKVDGETKHLKGHLFHYNYGSIDEFLRKMSQIYTSNEAENLIKEGYKINTLDAIRMPFNEFISRYFVRKGYKDGLHGLVLSLLMAFYHLVVFAKVWEKQRFIEKQVSLHMFEKEFSKIKKDTDYWIKRAKMQNEKNIVKKILIKLMS